MTASAASFEVLHAFRGPDGAGPIGGLAIDAAGTVYGTTVDHGAHGGGTLFALSGGTLTTLHDFGADDDGRAPYDDTLLVGADGSIFGSTAEGGTGRNGTLFAWRGPRAGYEILYSFPANGEAGKAPRSGLAKGPDGALYGTASGGGDPICRSGAGCGTVFRFDVAGRRLTTLHAFSTEDRISYPWSTPVLSGDQLAGTAAGAEDSGSPYLMRRDGGRFSPVAIAFGTAQFEGGLTRVGGQLWGVSVDGSGDDEGTIYSVDGSGNFTPQFTFRGKDGAAPNGRLLPLGGVLYGTTAAGGGHGCGTVFRYVPGAGRVQTLHDFDCREGNAPIAGLVADGKGNLYGTTSAGGRFDNGTIFRLRP